MDSHGLIHKHPQFFLGRCLATSVRTVVQHVRVRGRGAPGWLVAWLIPKRLIWLDPPWKNRQKWGAWKGDSGIGNHHYHFLGGELKAREQSSRRSQVWANCYFRVPNGWNFCRGSSCTPQKHSGCGGGGLEAGNWELGHNFFFGFWKYLEGWSWLLKGSGSTRRVRGWHHVLDLRNWISFPVKNDSFSNELRRILEIK